MKKAMMGLLVTYVATLAPLAHADNDWKEALKCDGGAGIVKNRETTVEGRKTLEAEIVINDLGILKYFNGTHAIQSRFGDTSWTALSDDSPGNSGDPLLSFGLNLPPREIWLSSTNRYYKSSAVNFYGNTLKVDLHTPGGEANWIFRNCDRQ